MKVGDLLWRLDGTTVLITGETSVSWIIGPNQRQQEKISKKLVRETGTDGSRQPKLFSTPELAEEHSFLMRNRYDIGTAVGWVSDPKIMRQIAELIGYQER